MLSGMLVASADSRKIVIRGAEFVRDAIAGAFGPQGASVAISQAFGGTIQLQRGAQIACGIKSSNPLEEKGIEQIRAAASAVYDSAGDCTKLVSILAAGFMTKGQVLIEKGHHPADVVGGLERSVKSVLWNTSFETPNRSQTTSWSLLLQPQQAVMDGWEISSLRR